MNFEKFRFTKTNPKSLAKSVLNEFKKIHQCVARYRQYCFLSYNNFCKLLIITKYFFIDS